MADRNTQIFSVDRLLGRQDGTFCRTVYVVKFDPLGRSHGGKLLAADRQGAQAGRSVRRNSELAAHLCRHEGHAHIVIPKIFAQCGQVQTDVLRHDAYTAAARQRGIQIHHVRVKAVACVGRVDSPLCQIIFFPVPFAEISQVAVLQNDALGNAR